MINWQKTTDDWNQANKTYFKNSKAMLKALLKEYSQCSLAIVLKMSPCTIKTEMERQGIVLGKNKGISCADKMRSLGLDKMKTMTSIEIAKAVGEKNNTVGANLNYHKWKYKPYVRVTKPKVAIVASATPKIKTKGLSREYWGDDDTEKYCPTCTRSWPIEYFRVAGWQERYTTCVDCEAIHAESRDRMFLKSREGVK